MTEPIIRTRPLDDEAEVTLKLNPSISTPSPSISTSTTDPTPSSSMDFLWNEYSSYLSSTMAQQSVGLDIYPTPSFVIKSSLLPSPTPSAPSLDKLFINVCTDPAIDPPSLIDTIDGPAPAGSLRLPMSIGPEGRGVDKGGRECVVVDVVVHPQALEVEMKQQEQEEAYRIACGQAKLIERRDGVAPTVLTPQATHSLATAQVRRTVAQFALSKLEEKYKLKVDQSAEPKFLKLKYMGTTPPPSQRIKRSSTHPLHQQQPNKRLIEEVGQAKEESKEAKEEVASVQSVAENTGSAPVVPKRLEREDEQPTEQKGMTSDPQPLETANSIDISVNKNETNLVRSPPVFVTPSYDLLTSHTSDSLTLHIHLPGVVSRSSIEVTITTTDVQLTTGPSSDHPRYELSVPLPHRVDEESGVAKFNGKKQRLTLRLTRVGKERGEERKGEDVEKVVGEKREEKESGECVDRDERKESVVDWVSRLALTNSLISQSCMG